MVTSTTPRLSKNEKFYIVNGSVEVPRVTSQLGVIAKPQLIPWACKLERAEILQHCEELAAFNLEHGLTDMPAHTFRDGVKARLGKPYAHTTFSGEAMSLGTETHNIVEWRMQQVLDPYYHLKVEEPVVSERCVRAVESFERWLKRHTVEPLEIELTLAETSNKDKRFWCAGTLDLLAKIDGKITLLDWKTGSGLYWEYQLQNAIYRKMVDNHPDLPNTEQGMLILLPKRSNIKFKELVLPLDYRKELACFRAAQLLHSNKGG